MCCVSYQQAGSVQVRIRRDADEQMVLAHVYNRLSNLISPLTLQIFKDDWTRASTYNLLGSHTFSSRVTSPTQSLTQGPGRGPSPTENLYSSGTGFKSTPLSPPSVSPFDGQGSMLNSFSQDFKTSTPLRAPNFSSSNRPFTLSGYGTQQWSLKTYHNLYYNKRIDIYN